MLHIGGILILPVVFLRLAFFVAARIINGILLKGRGSDSSVSLLLLGSDVGGWCYFSSLVTVTVYQKAMGSSFFSLLIIMSMNGCIFSLSVRTSRRSVIIP